MTTLGTGIFPLTVACGQPLSLQKTGKSLYKSVHCEGKKGTFPQMNLPSRVHGRRTKDAQ